MRSGTIKYCAISPIAGLNEGYDEKGAGEVSRAARRSTVNQRDSRIKGQCCVGVPRFTELRSRSGGDRTRGITITDSSDLLASAYDGEASDDGYIFLRGPTVDEWLILHELGHEVANKFDLQNGKFIHALRADFRGLSAREREQLAYFRDPHEAFAELFSALYDPEDIAAQNPGIVRLIRARAVEKSMLDNMEGCGADG